MPDDQMISIPIASAMFALLAIGHMTDFEKICVRRLARSPYEVRFRGALCTELVKNMRKP